MAGCGAGPPGTAACDAAQAAVGGPPKSSPFWLRNIRSAVALDDPHSATPHGDGCRCGREVDAGTAPTAGGGGRADGLVRAKANGLTRVQCSFASPLRPDGPCVRVREALVDTGSSDCELLPQLLRCLQPLPIVASGAVYETSTGGEEYVAYEVLLTVQGRTCAAVVTCSDASSSDDALIGHMPIGALDFLVDSRSRRLVPRCRLRDALDEDVFHASHVQPSCASTGGLHAVHAVQVASTRRHPLQQHDPRDGPAPVWLARNACAVAIEGLDDVRIDIDMDALPDVDLLGRPIVPVTYVPCCFASPLDPTGPRAVVHQALVDTGAADCELREGFVRQLGPLPVVARGIMYETVAGRVMHDSYEVLLHVGGRSCAAVVTVTPEERFAADAEDPNTDEAIIGYAALAALHIVVDCNARSIF